MDSSTLINSVETRAHANIALIKYWGKQNELYKIPFQSSISFTVDKFYTDTVITKSDYNYDELYINGKVASSDETIRIQNFLNLFRKMYHQTTYFKINSTNHVPKAAGLASSSSAFASIALGLNVFCKLKLKDKDISKLARLGSGSASRSIYGNFAVWHHGNSHDSSYSESLDISWDELVMVVIMTDKRQKKISSSSAMKKSVNHISYANYLQQSKKDFNDMLIALPTKDIKVVGSIMQRNSNLMHDTINQSGIDFYNKKTYDIINKINNLDTSYNAFYTIDAGPNVKVLTLEKSLSKLLKEFEDFEVIVCKKGPKAYVKSIN